MNRIAVTAVICLITVAVLGPAAADDFRVETAVFVSHDKKPAVESLTVFNGEKIYDFLLTSPQETIIIDLARGRFLLLDIERHVKTEMLVQDVVQFNAQLRELAVPRDAELFHPDFKYSHDPMTGWHVLASDRLTYRGKGVAASVKEGADRYREFADLSAQLNALRPANLPPFARMRLNQILAENNVVPKEIEREVTITSVVPFKKAKVRSQHTFYWVLNQGDHRRIRSTEDQLANFATVEPDAYFDLQPAAPKR